MKYVVIGVRILFGVWFIMSGLRYWQPDMPMGRTMVAIDLMNALVDSQLMLIVKLIELGVGLLLVANVFVPLALIIGFPVTVVVAYVCLVIEWPHTRPLIGGSGTLLAHVFLLIAYFQYYRSFLTLKSTPLK